MTSEGFLELMLFFAMMIGVCLATYEMLFPQLKKPHPITEKTHNAEEEGE